MMGVLAPRFPAVDRGGVDVADTPSVALVLPRLATPAEAASVSFVKVVLRPSDGAMGDTLATVGSLDATALRLDDRSAPCTGVLASPRPTNGAAMVASSTTAAGTGSSGSEGAARLADRASGLDVDAVACVGTGDDAAPRGDRRTGDARRVVAAGRAAGVRMTLACVANGSATLPNAASGSGSAAVGVMPVVAVVAGGVAGAAWAGVVLAIPLDSVVVEGEATLDAFLRALLLVVVVVRVAGFACSATSTAAVPSPSSSSSVDVGTAVHGPSCRAGRRHHDVVPHSESMCCLCCDAMRRARSEASPEEMAT